MPDIPIDPELQSQLEASLTSTDHPAQHTMYNLPSPLTTDTTTDHLQDASSTARDAFHLDGFGFFDNMATGYDDQRRNKRPRLDTPSMGETLSMPSSALNNVNGDPRMLQPLLEPFDIGLLSDIFSMGDPYPMPNLACTPLSTISATSEAPTRPSDAPSDAPTDPLRVHQNPVLDHSRRLFRQLPHVLQEKPNSPPRFEIDETTYQSIRDDIISRSDGQDCHKSIPTIQELRRFFVGYVDCFHRHLPIIHLPSLVLSATPSPLILALSSIGALYRLDRRRAVSTYHLTLALLRKV